MTTHIEEFAGQLRLLKERSGRSYGMLAARLHVSTSTLHRYCNGAAVPSDYAPVERFARQCGASAEELVALHQRWLLADAARRRGPNHGSEPAPKPAAADPADVAFADRPFADLPVVPHSPTGPEVLGLPDAVDAPPARGRRTARRAQAALAVAALAAVLTLALHNGGGTNDTGSSSPTTGSPTHPSASVPTTGRRTVRAAGSASASTTPTPSARPVGDAKPPVEVTVLWDNWDTQCDQWFLLQQQPGEVPPPPSLQQTNAWGAALGGIPAQDLRLQLTAQGRSGEPVVLNALYVKVVSSAAAPKGIGYTPGSGCGGGIDPASFGIDLDTTVPRARAVPGDLGNGKKPGTADFPFKVSATDTEVLDVDAHTLDHDVRWYLDLVWTSGSRQGTLRIDNHGTPFRTTGLRGAPRYFYNGTTWAPTEQS